MNRAVPVASLFLTLLVTGCAMQRVGMAEAAERKGDYRRSADIWRSMAKRGQPDAQFRLGQMLIAGQGVKRDLVEASNWFRKAAEQGHTTAQTLLGGMYLSDKADARRDANAERWMQQAAKTADSKYRLAIHYLIGGQLERDPQRAIELFRSSAEHWATTRRTIAHRLEDDDLLLPAAEIGLADAQHHLAQMYIEGNGVPQSGAQAAKWYYLAANQGHAEAQIALANLYDTGRGVDQDYAEAARWLLKAAKQGNADAQLKMGSVYRTGRGVPANLVQAHMWFNLAAAQGNGAAKEKRTKTLQKLTKLQALEAEKLAVEFVVEE